MASSAGLCDRWQLSDRHRESPSAAPHWGLRASMSRSSRRRAWAGSPDLAATASMPKPFGFIGRSVRPSVLGPAIRRRTASVRLTPLGRGARKPGTEGGTGEKDVEGFGHRDRTGRPSGGPSSYGSRSGRPSPLSGRVNPRRSARHASGPGRRRAASRRVGSADADARPGRIAKEARIHRDPGLFVQ